MNNKKSLLQDSLQELENIKNESLELAKEQLINESADLLEKKSAALFEKLIANEEDESIKEIVKAKQNGDKSYTVEYSDGTSKTIAVSNDAWDEINNKYGKSNIDESSYINEMLNELKDLDSDEEDMDSDEMDSDEEEMDSDEEEMSLDALRKAAEEQGFKLVQADSDEEDIDDSDDEEDIDDSDDEEEEDDEEDIDDSDDEEEEDDEEDIEFNDDDEFSDVDVDNKVLADPSDDEEEEDDEEDEESFQKINENLKRKNTKMRNTKKQVLKDLRDVSFNKLVEAYYNMGETDSFIIKENENRYMENYDTTMEEEDFDPTMEENFYDEDFDPTMDENLYEDDTYGMDEELYEDDTYDFPPVSPSQMMPKSSRENVMYEVELPEMGDYNQPMFDEDIEMTDEELNEMLEGMETGFSQSSNRTNREAQKVSGIGELNKRSDFSFTKSKGSSELEEMFENMSLEELQEMEGLLHEEGDGGVMEDNGILGRRPPEALYDATNVEEDYMEEKDLTEAQIEEMLAEMGGEHDLEESSAINSRRFRAVANNGARESGQVGIDRRSPSAKNDTEDFKDLQEQVKKLKQENKALNEGFTNKVKSLENKVYDVTISALKAGFVNKFLLEHPLRENEKLQIIHRFTNAQTKEQIKETYISLTNEFAKGQTVKDGSMLNESVQNRVGKVHRTDNVVVTEKNLMNENDESNRFKQLLNYNFNKKK